MENIRDYLELEEGVHNEGSINWMIQQLVKTMRFMRERIPANEISDYLPQIQEIEKKLQKHDTDINYTPREYIHEIWAVLENEPEADDSRMQTIFQLKENEAGEITLIHTGESFHFKRRADRWLRELSTPDKKYIVLEVVQT